MRRNRVSDFSSRSKGTVRRVDTRAAAQHAVHTAPRTIRTRNTVCGFIREAAAATIAHAACVSMSSLLAFVGHLSALQHPIQAVASQARCHTERRRLRTLHHREVDRDLTRLSAHVSDRHAIAVPLANLTQQRDGIVVVAKAHGLAGCERIERAENSGVAKALGDAARVEGVELVGLEMEVCGGHWFRDTRSW